MIEAGTFPPSESNSCNDNNDHFMINTLMMQQQQQQLQHPHHHHQFGTGAGGYTLNCDYRQPPQSAGAAAVMALPRLHASADHHQYGSHLSVAGTVVSSSGGGFPPVSAAGGLMAVAGGIAAGQAQSSSGGNPTYGGGIPARISTSGISGIPPSQSRGGGGISTQASGITAPATAPSRYESQKRRDWNTFGQYLRNSRPPLLPGRCNGEHVLQFLRYLDQFGKTKVHGPRCPYFGLPHPPGPCECPLRQAWGSLDALIGRLRAAFEEHGGKPESNPFGARPVRLYLREVRELQAKARGIAYEKKKRKRPKPPPVGTCSNPADTISNFSEPPASSSSSSSGFLISGCN